ncbi:MAG: glycosyltransferase [Candidatus Dormiibacterota bacterium]
MASSATQQREEESLAVNGRPTVLDAAKPVVLNDVTAVEIAATDPGRFATVLSRAQFAALSRTIERASRIFEGRRVWNINSTAAGGGVAEMLSTLLPYARGAGVDTGWLVISGDDEFFTITKRIHNRLHGALGDGGDLTESDREHYETVLAHQAGQIRDQLRSGDIVILHDPQTAGLAPLLSSMDIAVLWRCHVGMDTPNAVARDTWAFLLPYVRAARMYVFSRQVFAWDGLDSERIRVIAPSIDPFSPKNCEMDDPAIQAVLAAAGVVTGGDGDPVFTRLDGRRDRVQHTATMVEASPVDAATPLVVQVSRWDRLKDPLGVLEGFVHGVIPKCDAHLMLAGPNVQDVADDPEGAETYQEVVRRWECLESGARSRVHLACLPMDDEEENAAVVNALQRRSQVVVQKSIAEGFGLTVAEAMWKSRAVVASRIGGIQDQIEHCTSGYLLNDPTDEAEFASAVCTLLGDRRLAARVGKRAHARVQDAFLGSRHLAEYVDLCAALQ